MGFASAAVAAGLGVWREGGTRKGPKFIYRKVPSRDSGIKVFLKRKKRIDSKMCSCNYAYFCEITGALFL